MQQHTFPPIMLDACCVISLYASRYLEDVLRAYPASIGVVDIVKEDEILYVKGSVDASGKYQKIPIDLQPLVDQGLLVDVPYVDEDAALAVSLSTLDLGPYKAQNGECFTIAAAYRMGWGVSTDDTPIRELLLAQHFPTMPVLTTSYLLNNWAEVGNKSATDIRGALQSMRSHGGYRLSDRDPLIHWLQRFI